jgi:hypothetical protein
MIANLCLLLAPLLGAEPLLQDAKPSGTPAATSGLSYTYVQFDIIRGDGHGFGNGPDGIDLRGSYAFEEGLFVFGGVSHTSGDVGNSSLDVNTIGVGLGFHTALDARTDLVLGGSLLHAESDSGAPGGSADGDGYSLQAGLRHDASAQFELSGTLGFSDYDKSDSNTWIELGVVYRATPKLGLCGTLSTSDDFNALSFGLRYQP